MTDLKQFSASAGLSLKGLAIASLVFFAVLPVQAEEASPEPVPAEEPVVAKADPGVKAGADKSAAADKSKGDPDDEEEDVETLEEMVKDLEKIEGLFTFYRDKDDGSLAMEVTEAQLADGVEFIYQLQNINGASNVGGFHSLGDYASRDVIRISRHFKKILIEKQNTRFYFDPDNALSRAADANLLPALVSVDDIVATSEDGQRHLIDADGLFGAEKIEQISPSSYPDSSGPETFGVGSINPEKTRVLDVRSWTHNSNVVVSYTFDNAAPTHYGGPDITDGRSVTVVFQHSLIAMPEPGFEPRANDHRVGYFMERVTDLTDGGVTPYRDLINRWRLVKKDPEAEVSDPVKPITYWITNSTPVEYRETIREAALHWNDAFEKAGFSNALVVKIQPDDATWEPGDIDYNTIRWISPPNPTSSGVGYSMANPRTGEMIAADIIIEESLVSDMPDLQRSFSEAGLARALEGADFQARGHERCAYGAAMKQQTAYGIVNARAMGASEEELADLKTQAIRLFTLHEVGHTLGLAHNMRATQYVPYQDVHDEKHIKSGVLSASVMDYSAINVGPDMTGPKQYYSVYPGPYDFWAIDYGYRAPLKDEADEAARLEALLARSTEPGLAFGNDADDMRSPMRGADPRVQVFDLSDDAIAYGADLMALSQERMGALVERYAVEGQTWADMRAAWLILTGQKSGQARVITGYIGGVYIENATIGQDHVPFTAVPRADQRRAMQALETYIFAPGAWTFDEEVLRHLKAERRGWDFWESPGGEDPRIHDRVLAIQTRVLGSLLHPNTTGRMLDSSLYGNTYPPADVFQELTDAIIVADLRSPVNSYRQNLQLLYTNMLVAIATQSGAHAFPVQSAALYQLKRIERMERQGKSRDLATSAHRQHVRHVIETALYGEGAR